MSNFKQFWFSKYEAAESIRVVLFEKNLNNTDSYTTIYNFNEDYDTCFYINGVRIIVIVESSIEMQPNKFGNPKISPCTIPTRYNKNTLDFIVVWNYPIGLLKSDSKIICRLSKFIFKAKAYNDSINNKIVINYL